jgi:hypothetical protein
MLLVLLIVLVLPAMVQIRVGNVRIAACLLSMMFIYDIFWVFLSK